MRAQEIVQAVYQFLGLLTAWPVILLIVFLIFRHEIRQILPTLAGRIKKADIGGSSFEFTEVAAKAFQDTIVTGIEKLEDNPKEFVSYVQKQVNKLSETGASLGATRGSLPLSRRSILWVDDEPLNNTFEVNFLKRLGARILQVPSTEQAMIILDQDNYDLIISDVHRIEHGRENPYAGYELLDLLNKRKEPTPLIFYTGSVTQIDENRARSAVGVADEPTTLYNLVLKQLKR